MKEIKCKSIQTKQNFTNAHMRLAASVQLTQKNDDSHHLPQISSITSTSHNQKTLSSVIKRLQRFIQEYEGTPPAICLECLQTLKYFVKENIKLPKISVLKEMQSNSSNNSSKFLSKKKEDTFGVESLVMNVKREYLKKVDSRYLFQKMRTIKYDQNQSSHTQQAKQLKIVNTLKAKVADQDKVIRGLHEMIQKQKLHIQNLKLTVHTLMKNDQTTQKKMAYQQKLKELNEQISSLQNIIKEKEDENIKQNQKQQQKYKTAEDNCNQLRQTLQQRQTELVSIWQMCHAESRIQFL